MGALMNMGGQKNTPGAPGGGMAAKSDEDIAEELKGVDQDLKQAGTSDDALIDLNTAFGHKVIRNSLPPIDTREHDKFTAGEYFEMGSKYPGGDMMNQLGFFKWKHPMKLGTNVSVPPEEDWYSGARLGEYGRPLVMAEGKVGYLNQAPVPMSETEDFLTLAAESGVGSRRARNAALYARASAGQAEEFYRLAQRRMRQVLRDPILTVRPGADVYPLYSASMPVALAVPAPPQLPCRCRDDSRSPPCRFLAGID
jgi:hypothetical protein